MKRVFFCHKILLALFFSRKMCNTTRKKEKKNSNFRILFTIGAVFSVNLSLNLVCDDPRNQVHESIITYFCWPSCIILYFCFGAASKNLSESTLNNVNRTLSRTMHIMGYDMCVCGFVSVNLNIQSLVHCVNEK